MKKLWSLLIVTVLCMTLITNVVYAEEVQQEMAVETAAVNESEEPKNTAREISRIDTAAEVAEAAEAEEAVQPEDNEESIEDTENIENQEPAEGEPADPEASEGEAGEQPGEEPIEGAEEDIEEVLSEGEQEEQFLEEAPEEQTEEALMEEGLLEEAPVEEELLTEEIPEELLLLEEALAIPEDTAEVSTFEELKLAAASAPKDGSLFTIIITDDISTQSTDGAVTVASGQNILVCDDGEMRTINRIGNRCAEVFRVNKGGILTLESSGGLVISGESYSDGNYDNREKGVVSVLGEFILDGAEIRGFTLRTYYSAGVYVAGKGTFTMESGSINDFTCNNQVCSPVFVWENGEFIMNGGTISGNVVAPKQLDTAAVRIESYKGHSSFTMNGGEISGNESYCGAVFAGLLNNDLFYSPSWKTDLASVTINDGTISDNQAYYSGGGISIMGSGELTMNGGTITGNTAPMGGGIAVYDMYKAFENQTPLSAKAFEKAYNMPARITVNGGTISDNSAIGNDDSDAHSAASDMGCGGGLYISTMNAEINAAEILNNYAEHQGGGIYVGAIPYEIQIRNAVVTENTADDIGAGIWTCPTGSVVEWLVNGVAVYGNVLTNGEQQDRYYEAKVLGLAPVVKNNTEDDYNWDLNTGDVQIRYNHSEKGGGLGTNGTYIFGDDLPVPPETAENPPEPPITGGTVTPPEPGVPEDPETPPDAPDPEVPSETPELKTTVTPPQPEPEVPAPAPEVHRSSSYSFVTAVEETVEELNEPQLDQVPKTGPEDEQRVDDMIIPVSEAIATIELKDGYIIPVAQAPLTDPLRYLRRDLNGKYTSHGTIFADALCSMGSDNLLLYGHNMMDGSMFACLSQYEDKRYFDSHRIINIRTLTGELLRFMVLAVFRDKVYYNNEDCFKYYRYAGKLDTDSYKEYLTNVMKKSGTGFAMPDYGTQLLTMSTCAYHTDNGRLVVVAQRI